ncbi:ankyrin repeat-containing domain protein [Daldinia caldariorum]|uniref:ankyrin repeat-containing domain protein n=1 Tax=Daldinia caldariorum TaxID=326644 RepID=UPI0020073AEB|nr:ankyrin repeat-containing domain protein [Daldinia caldariorum]KAI1466260.1 ankyrin repeat-containing domain protein [Daldinia caldariorum]
MSVSVQALAESVEHACGTIADLLVSLSKLVPLAKASLLPVAAECLTMKTVMGNLGGLLTPGGPTDPYVVYEDHNRQVESLGPCFEVILHAISEILVDVDHETTRLRRYHSWGDPLASSKAVPATQDFFIDAGFCLRRSRSSLYLIIDCLQRGILSGATIQLIDQTFLTHPSFTKIVESSRLQPLVAIELRETSKQPDVRSLLSKYRSKSLRPRENDHSLTRMLHHAITGWDYNAVHRCLLAKTNPDTPLEESGIAPIHRALGRIEVALASENKTAVRTSTSIVMALLIAGASLKVRDENGRTPLIRATMNEMPDTLISLMLEFGACPDAKDGHKNTALHYAAMKVASDEMGNVDTVRILLAHGADQSLRSKRGRTPLHEAVSFECFDRGRELLDYGADSEIADNNGWTPLLCAVTQGNLAFTEFLCDRGAIVDKKDKNGYTALHYAISQGSEEISKALLDAGADVNLISKGETPLCRATSKSNLRLVKLLLSYDADVDLPSPGYYGALSIHVAAMGRDVAISEALLGAGSPINALDDEGRTPLRWAMDGGKNELVHFLMSKGAAK